MQVVEVKDSAEMTAAEVRHAREILRLSEGDLAAELGVVPDVVVAFETGAVRIPPRIGKILRWRVALEERERALTAAGHGPCAESVALVNRFRAPRADPVATMKAFQEHTAECGQCQAREAFARTLPPVPEPPSSPTGRAFHAFVLFTERLPGWARPAAWGAAVVGTIVLVRVIIMMLGTGPSWHLVGLAALGLSMGAYLGAVGGITYHFVHPRARSLGRIAPYVTAIACTVAYMLAFLLPAALMGDDIANDPGDWVAAGAIAVLFGLFLGYIFRNADA